MGLLSPHSKITCYPLGSRNIFLLIATAQKKKDLHRFLFFFAEPFFGGVFTCRVNCVSSKYLSDILLNKELARFEGKPISFLSFREATELLIKATQFLVR